jgi:hypothetical protein
MRPQPRGGHHPEPSYNDDVDGAADTCDEEAEGASNDDDDGDEGDAGDDSPDQGTAVADRPASVDHRAAALAHLPLGGKPNPKHLTIRQFNDRIQPGDFDSGVRLWTNAFVSQLIGAQLRDRHRWTDPVQCSIVLACLTEEAAAWFDRVWASTPDLTVQRGLGLLVDKYATKIGEDAIRERIKQARREPVESYEMYAQRLQNMASALPGGIEEEANAAAALSAFVNTAYPAEFKQLRVFETNDKRHKGSVADDT